MKRSAIDKINEVEILYSAITYRPTSHKKARPRKENFVRNTCKPSASVF